MESVKKKCKSVFSSRGCFGRYKKPPLSIVAIDEPSKGLKIQGRMVKKPDASEDIWSTSSYEMNHSAIESQRSISSFSTSNIPSDSHSSKTNPVEFVNHGLLLWNQTRQQWRARGTSQKPGQVREHVTCWNMTYERLLSTNKPYPRPIPLSKMVDFLVDVWEHEGLYD